MYRLMLLLVGVSSALAASVGTGYASPTVRDVLSERFKVSRIDVPNQSDEGHVIKKGTVLLLQADGVPAGILRTTQINTKSPRFHVHDYARNWLLVTLALFAGSGLIYLGRTIRAGRRSDR